MDPTLTPEGHLEAGSNYTRIDELHVFDTNSGARSVLKMSIELPGKLKKIISAAYRYKNILIRCSQ